MRKENNSHQKRKRGNVNYATFGEKKKKTASKAKTNAAKKERHAEDASSPQTPSLILV